MYVGGTFATLDLDVFSMLYYNITSKIHLNDELNRQILSIYLMRSGVANVYPKYIEYIDFFRIDSCTSMSSTA